MQRETEIGGAADEPIAPLLLAWFDQHGRHDLPWQHPRTPYRVWLAEIMLQQTQVAVVDGYFRRFVERLPTLGDLAAASEDEVLALWSGLGYYSRARNLHRAARLCVQQHGGELPRDLQSLQALPGIGRSTAGAILAQAHGSRVAMLDGNARRVLARLHGIEGWPGSSATERQLWALAEAYLPDIRLVDYTQALMDFGATLCRRSAPACTRCPLRQRCVAWRSGRVAELPARRARAPARVRECVMLVIVDRDAQVLLQRRPASGVWAQLWSLPEWPDAGRAGEWLQRHVDLGAAVATDLPVIEHAFSHYRLRVHAQCWREAAAVAALADAPDLRWIGATELDTIGLPAPVRRLLESALA